jgi:hypothetical protein
MYIDEILERTLNEAGEIQANWIKDGNIRQVRFQYKNHSMREYSNGQVTYYVRGKEVDKEDFMKHTDGKNVGRGRAYADELVQDWFAKRDNKTPVYISGKKGKKGFLKGY